MAQEKILKQQKEREVQANIDLLDRQGQEMDLLKALLAKLQKYERDLDKKPEQKRKQEVSKPKEISFKITLECNFQKILTIQSCISTSRLKFFEVYLFPR